MRLQMDQVAHARLSYIEALYNGRGVAYFFHPPSQLCFGLCSGESTRRARLALEVERPHHAPGPALNEPYQISFPLTVVRVRSDPAPRGRGALDAGGVSERARP
jgi:hypothetical protein